MLAILRQESFQSEAFDEVKIQESISTIGVFEA
jgi:hypothetical protein